MWVLAEVLLSIILGCLTWSLAEYGLHNWLGHHGLGKNHFSREHLRHHARTHYFAPEWQKVLATIIVTALLAPVAMLVSDVLMGLTYTVSFVSLYLTYEHLHRRAHTHRPRTAYGRWLRRHHFSHHFNSPKFNHGVTSALWDHVFRTYRPVEQVRVPRKKAMPWLINPATDELWPIWRVDYVLTGRKDTEVRGDDS